MTGRLCSPEPSPERAPRLRPPPRLLEFIPMTAPATLHDEDALGKAFDLRLTRRLLAYARPYRRIVVAALALLIVDGLFQLAQPLLTRHVIDVAVPAGDGRAV